MIFNGKKRQDGFSIIEISIGLIITGLVMVAFLKAYRVHVERVKLESEKALMADIRQYIDAFPNKIIPPPDPDDPDAATYIKKPYGRLPCPAPLDATGYGNDYNEEDPSITPVAGTTGPVLIGKIPTGTLGIASSYMKDLNKEYLLYAVTQSACDEATYASSTGAITVTEESINSDQTSATYGEITEDDFPNTQYVILSFGDNQKGAYAFDGTQPSACPDDAVTEHENCDGDSIFKASLRYDQDNDDAFDDIVRFSTNSATTTTASNVKTLRPARSGEDYEYAPAGDRFTRDNVREYTMSTDGYFKAETTAYTNTSNLVHGDPRERVQGMLNNGHHNNEFFKVQAGDIITIDESQNPGYRRFNNENVIQLNGKGQIPDDRKVTSEEVFVFGQTPTNTQSEGLGERTIRSNYGEDGSYTASDSTIEIYVGHN
ncbi:MAG: hypothetical protein ACRBCT_08190 [Alphaproteobacteria bacterium]